MESAMREKYGGLDEDISPKYLVQLSSY